MVVQSNVLVGLKSRTVVKVPFTGLARKRYQSGPGFVSEASTVHLTTVPIVDGANVELVSRGVIAACKGTTAPRIRRKIKDAVVRHIIRISIRFWECLPSNKKSHAWHVGVLNGSAAKTL